MKTLRIAMRSFADFEAALSAQLAAYRTFIPGEEVLFVPLDLRSLETAVLRSSGLRSGEWDLAIFPTDWTGTAVRSGAIESLEPWMQAQPLPGWPEGWPPSLVDPLRRNGEFYSIPWHDGPECLIYRKDLFEQSSSQEAFSTRFHRELAPPATWQEFHDTARFFTDISRGHYGTVFAAYPDGHNTLYDLTLQVWSRGGELYRTDGSPSLAGEIAVEALDYYRTIVNDPQACYPGASQIDSISSGDVFLSGRIAMMVNWFGFAARSNRIDSALRGKIGLAPIPGGHAGQTASLSNYWVIAIGSGSREKEASYKLLRHLASPAMDKLTSLNGAVGVRLSTWQDPEVLHHVPFYSQLEELSRKARTLPFCQDLPRLAEIVNQVIVNALGTDEASAAILERAQQMAISQRLRLR